MTQILPTHRNYSVAREYIMQSTDLVLTSHHRPEYTPEERQQVADWMNGHDQPLPEINVVSWPGVSQLGHPVMYPPRMVAELGGYLD